MSEGVVTDKVVIQKSVYYYNGNKILLAIDIRPQPIFQSYFLGEGKFSLSDDELKLMLEELIEETKKYIETSDIVSFTQVSLDNIDITITQNNYAVANYCNGILTLTNN